MPRAILSVYDKTNLVQLAKSLHEAGWELIASGGTAAALRGAGLPVREVAEVTGYPELLDGRVKTLHPAIHAGILATGSAAHQEELRTHHLSPIDLVVCNLYPFEATVARRDATLAEAVEQIDIGGVTLLRAAAKNFERVAVLADPQDYAPFLAELQAGSISFATRKLLAYKAFAHAADYDAAIRDYLAAEGFAGSLEEEERTAAQLPAQIHLDLRLAQPLRYGENPHQAAGLYNLPGVDGPLGGRLLHGKPLSYNNLLDLDAAWRSVRDFGDPAIAIVKHTNPCGLAIAGSLAAAYPLALAGDPEAAFGGILAANRIFDEATAGLIGSLFLECIVAPAFEPAALERLSKRANLRLLELGLPASAGRPVAGNSPAAPVPPNSSVPLPPPSLEFRSVQGGLLAQEPDPAADDEAEWRVATQRVPTEAEWQGLRFAWAAVRHLKSNAIAFVQPYVKSPDGTTGTALVGAGAGQMSRVDAVHMAARKAGERARGAVVASDAFFPFPDGVEMAAAAGVTAAIQPGGSVRDPEVIAAAERLGMTMVLTGKRHFKH